MTHSRLATLLTIAVMVLGATVGETLVSAAMTRVGDLHQIRKEKSLSAAVGAVVQSPLLLMGVGCMAVSFFALLVALSGADLSFVAPATNSLTFVATAFSARFFLRENVDRRRWIAAIFVAAGVLLLAR